MVLWIAQTLPKYLCIFNVINTDDLVPELPLNVWRFTRYGTDVPGSIEDDYAGQWDSLMGGTFTYTSNRTAMQETVSAFEGIADDRDQCYLYHEGLDAYYVDCVYPTSEAAEMAVKSVTGGYPENTNGTYYWVPTGSAMYYGYAIYHQPAFLMQLIAAKMGGVLSDLAFGTIMVPTYLWEAKGKLTSFAKDGFMSHPHYVESYYLLARNVSV